jgi:quinolinate synthase
MEFQIEIDPEVAVRARRAVERMVAIGRKVTD